MEPARPGLVWTLTVIGGLAAAVLGLVSVLYAQILAEELTHELLPIPEHVPWMLWLGAVLLLVGGALALVQLVRRARGVV